jgi:hypothetical protein
VRGSSLCRSLRERGNSFVGKNVLAPFRPFRPTSFEREACVFQPLVAGNYRRYSHFLDSDPCRNFAFELLLDVLDKASNEVQEFSKFFPIGFDLRVM